MKNKISEAFSFKGWDIKELIYRNKDFLKWIVPGILSLLITNNLIDAGFATILGKFILDTIDFYVTEVKLK
jgi:hypothetical protein